jgi:hypothetical protein
MLALLYVRETRDLSLDDLDEDEAARAAQLKAGIAVR